MAGRSFPSAARILLAALLFAACGRAPEDKIKGWPPPPAPPRAPGVPDVAPPPPPDTSEPVDEPEIGAPDPDGDSPLPLPDDPCEAVVALACHFFGEYTDDCGEARTRVPDSADPETRAACEVLVTRFLGEEQENRVSPCRRFARKVCQADGYPSRACRRARGHISKLRGERKRVCLGDLILWETRDLRFR